MIAGSCGALEVPGQRDLRIRPGARRLARRCDEGRGDPSVHAALFHGQSRDFMRRKEEESSSMQVWPQCLWQEWCTDMANRSCDVLARRVENSCAQRGTRSVHSRWDLQAGQKFRRMSTRSPFCSRTLWWPKSRIPDSGDMEVMRVSFGIEASWEERSGVSGHFQAGQSDKMEQETRYGAQSMSWLSWRKRRCIGFILGICLNAKRLHPHYIHCIT